MQLYVVQVTHTAGGHGPVSQPVLLTENPAVALTACIGIEAAGFRLLNDGDGAQIFRLEVGKVEVSEGFVDGNEFSAPGMLVYYRIRYKNGPGGWLTAWLDPVMEQTYRCVFEPLM